MCLLLIASAFFHSARSLVDRGDLHQNLRAWRAFFTTVLQSSSHHGRLGSERVACDGFDFLKHELFALFSPVMNMAYATFGSRVSKKLHSRSVVDMRRFQFAQLLSFVIQEGGCPVLSAGVVLSVVMIGR